MKRKRFYEDGVINNIPHKKRKVESYEIHKEDIPTHLMKYWYTRYFRFSKFDEGLWLNLDCLSESSYEEIAIHVSQRIGACVSGKITVLDAMCGCGVTTIQFALNPNIRKVIAVDINREKIEFAKHNCEVYGVNLEKIEFVEDDIFHFLTSRDLKGIDACFLSPPWGGSDYILKKDFFLEDVKFSARGENGISLFNKVISRVTQNICYSLPLNTSRIGFEKLNYSGKIEAETNYYNNKPKTKTFYFGNLLSTR